MHECKLMVGIEGTRLNKDTQALLKHPDIMGVILFTRNYDHPNQLKSLTKEIKQAREDLIVGVDQEGGRVQRFKKHFPELHPLRDLGHLYERNPDEAKQAAKAHAYQVGSHLKKTGVDFSFTPVLDLDDEQSTIIASRGFHHNPQIIADLMIPYLLGLKRARVPGVAKHYPGHGSVVADTHTDIVTDPRSLNDIWHTDLYPFRQWARMQGWAVMCSHIIYPCLGPEPAGFSKPWVNLLRGRIGYKGLIFSDDLGMESAGRETLAEKVNSSSEAGCDIALVCNILDELSDYLDERKI